MLSGLYGYLSTNEEPMRTLILALSVMLAGSAMGQDGAVAAQIPELIDAYALKLETECAASSGEKIAERSSQLINLVAHAPNGSTYVVDGAYTACSDVGPFCGTGGCPVGVFRVNNKSIETLYDENAFSWDVSPDREVPQH